MPLDAPGTLRPLLVRVFGWAIALFPQREQAAAAWGTLTFLALIVPVVLAVLYYGWRRGLVKLPAAAARVLCSRRLFFASIAVCLLLCRYPTLLDSELNPDEGQFLAAAHKLFYDGNFFHSVDCGTTGPLNIYPLMLPALFGISPDFASSRVIVLIIIFLSTLLLYRSVSLIGTAELARIAVLPFCLTFSVFRNPELVHYSSEHVSILITALALYYAVRVLRQPDRYRWVIVILGLLSSAAFFAKMQSVPIVGGIACTALAFVSVSCRAGKPWKPLALFISGAMPLCLLIAALCLAGGIWSDFWATYIRANISYADVQGNFVPNLESFLQYIVGNQEIRVFLYNMLAIAAAYVVERMRRRISSEQSLFVQLAVVSLAIVTALMPPPQSPVTLYTYVVLLAMCAVPVYLAVTYSAAGLGTAPVRWFGLMALVSVAASFFSIYRAHHGFVHYLLFLVLPSSIALAWMLMRQTGDPSGDDDETGKPRLGSASRGLAFVSLVIVFIVGYQTYIWDFRDTHVFTQDLQTRPPEGEFIRSLVRPDGRIFVWGWTTRPYLASGHVSDGRDLNVSSCFRHLNLMTSPPAVSPTPAAREVSTYYQRRLLHDLNRHPPQLFIDAVGPASWFLTNPAYFNFEQFPGLDQFVKVNYVLFANRYNQRYYLRRDLAALRPIGPAN